MLVIQDSCIRCGQCVRACPAAIIQMESEKPVLIQNGCIRCGHCEAVCPKKALKNDLLPDDTSIELDRSTSIDSKSAEIFLRSRRSIRCFKPDIVPSDLTEKLLNIGRYAETGSNSQGVSYMVLASPDKMKTFKDLTLSYYQKQDGTMMKALYQSFAEAKDDRVFRGAPMCILALTKKGDTYTQRNASFALTYIELMAPTLGLGTCWAGFVERYTSTDSPDLRRYLELPDDLVVSGVLLFGYPDIKYYRLPGRNPLAVFWR